MGVTAAFLATLALAVIALAVLAVRERSRRLALETGSREITEATERAAQADSQRRAAELSVEQQTTASKALAAEMEAAAGQREASIEARLTELRSTSSSRIAALETDLGTSEAERHRLAALTERHTAELRATSARVVELEATSAANRSARDAAAVRVSALEAELTEQSKLLTRNVGSVGPVDVGEPALTDGHPADRNDHTGWRLLLARVERQWAEVVNATDDERGVLDGAQSEQLAQAVQRDLERLREEVGVEATLAPAEPVDLIDPLTTLLAVGEAAALLAHHSEQVVVELRHPTVVSAQGWAGDDDARRRLEALAAAVSDSGLDATVEITDRSTQVLLGRPAQTSRPA